MITAGLCRYGDMGCNALVAANAEAMQWSPAFPKL